MEAGFRYRIPQLRSSKRDFYSARQDYAHAQQEEVTEERDLCPSFQEVSGEGGQWEGVVREVHC